MGESGNIENKTEEVSTAQNIEENVKVDEKVNKVDNIKEVDKSDKEEQERTEKAKALFLKKFEESLGIITYACAAVGIVRTTYYNWMAEDEKFKAEVERLKIVQIEQVEDKLVQGIVNDNMTAIIFYLKSRHSKYKNQITLTGNLNVNKFSNLTDDELEQQIRELEQLQEATSRGESEEIGTVEEQK